MVEARIAQEQERADAYLDVATTAPKLLRIVDDVFVSKQVILPLHDTATSSTHFSTLMSNFPFLIKWLERLCRGFVSSMSCL
jgi:hypothetical protein